MLYLLFEYEPNINKGNITSLIHISENGIAYNFNNKILYANYNILFMASDSNVILR